MPTIGASVDQKTFDKYKRIAEKKNISVSRLVMQALEKSKIVDEKKIANTELEKIRQIKLIRKDMDEILEHINTSKRLDVKVLMLLQGILNDCKNI